MATVRTKESTHAQPDSIKLEVERTSWVLEWRRMPERIFVYLDCLSRALRTTHQLSMCMRPLIRQLISHATETKVNWTTGKKY